MLRQLLMQNYLKLYSLLFATAFLLCMQPSAFGAVSLRQNIELDLINSGHLYQATDDNFPTSFQELPGWLSRHQTINRVNMLGGSYWFYAEIHNDSSDTEWVLDPDDTLIDKVEAHIFTDDDQVQQFVTGYRADHEYMLHYGKDIHLPPGSSSKILIRLQSPYYASQPDIKIYPKQDYRQHVLAENIQAIAAFGALITLALYNLFIFRITRDRALFYYAIYLLAYFTGWAFTFQLPAELFGWHDLRVHYIPFFLLPVLNTLFYTEFLRLKTNFPRLAAIGRINIVLPLILLPSCFFALSYAHMLATIAISIWLVIALISGLVSLYHGFRPARYFVMAFLALLIPGVLILPANLGLMPDLVDNAELLTLLGGTLDAILLAFALADKIRLLSEEKDHALHRLSKMLALASTDHLTGISNRHAFDLIFKQDFACPECVDDPHQQILVLIDLDGLKVVNDRFGHSRGDALLCAFATALQKLQTDGISVYRLGGDEFTILADKRHEDALRSALIKLEKELPEQGFEGTGISFGIASASESISPDDMLIRADRRMYENKISRRRARADDAIIPVAGSASAQGDPA
ncbi:MAG: sensor domain-containing diguanylate cyclase [Sulfuriferula sp.]|nr:sensor domain-containing diguanylate cyclase [Sulfuriferula sp.]